MEMPLLWKSQTDFHNSLEISHRTRDSHIPTADPDSYELTSEQAKSVTDVSGLLCNRCFQLDRSREGLVVAGLKARATCLVPDPWSLVPGS